MGQERVEHLLRLLVVCVLEVFQCMQETVGLVVQTRVAMERMDHLLRVVAVLLFRVERLGLERLVK